MRYQRIVQKPEQCGSACLEMILKRRGISDLTQEDIFEIMGMVLDENRLNLFFLRYRLPLTAEYHPISSIHQAWNDISDIRSFLINNLRESDIIANFWIRDLGHGHYALVDSVHELSVSFCDPEPRRDSVVAQFDALPVLMSSHYDGRERGFYVIKSSQA